MLLDNFCHIKNRQSIDFFIPMLCGFPSRRFKDVLVNKLEFSYFTSYGFLFPLKTPHPHAFSFLHAQNFVYTFYNTRYHIFSRSSTKEMASPCVIHSSPTHRRRLKLKIHKRLASVWAELITYFQDFCDSEHVPDEPIDSASFGASLV